jgi:hypothetical protein
MCWLSWRLPQDMTANYVAVLPRRCTECLVPISTKFLLSVSAEVLSNRPGVILAPSDRIGSDRIGVLFLLLKPSSEKGLNRVLG